MQELGGLVLAYLGPAARAAAAALGLPGARGPGREIISITPLPCNWLQCMDNSLDPVHFEHLHGAYGNYFMKQPGKPWALQSGPAT